MLQNHQGRIVDRQGRPIQLRGVNLGNWLLIEGYMLSGPNEPEHRIRQEFVRHQGATGRRFFERYPDIYIQEKDFRRIRSWGFNLVRIPFGWRTLEKQSGWRRLDRAIGWARRYGLYCLLDLHAAPGSQNADWHSDSPGRAELWHSSAAQRRTIKFWRRIAERYRKEPAVAGYDLLNEPMTDRVDILNRLYRQCLAAIRSAGDRHLVFLEGTDWSTDHRKLDWPHDPQTAYSPHFYKPYQFTFNFELDLTYPGRVDGRLWNRTALQRELAPVAQWSRQNKIPVLVGEFGINSRNLNRGPECRWLKDTLSVFNQFDFHWSYWAYKVISGHMHPSGLLRFPQNPFWIRREGSTAGWENMARAPRWCRRKMLTQLDSKYFTVDRPILKVLRGE